MKTRSVGVAAALFVVLWALPAGAHAPADSYPQGWNERTIDVFTSGASWTQIQNIRTAVMAGLGPWNANSANAGGFRFVDRGARLMSSLSCGTQLPNVNGIFWEQIDGPGGDVATTELCGEVATPTRVRAFLMRIDGQEGGTLSPPWHTLSTTPPAGFRDLRSVAVHEFGHATGGWIPRHWDTAPGDPAGIDPSLCPAGSTRHTMCFNVPTGTTYMRTLGTHDIHTFTNKY